MADRGLSAANQAASLAEVFRPVGFVRLDYASGDVLVTSAPFNLSWDWNGDGTPEEFVGVGALGSISRITESTELRPYSVTLQLSGIPAEYVALALGERYQGRDGRIWLGLLDADHVLVDTPVLVFRGRMDTQPIRYGKQVSIEVTLLSRLADWERARVRRFTGEDQQAAYPGDRGFEFVAEMVNKEIRWGIQ